VRGDVVEQEEGLRTGREDVVDAVRRQVLARVAQPPGPAREDELRPDAVGRGGEQQPLVQRIEPGEPPNAPSTPAVRVDSTASRSRWTTSPAAASETPAAS
jgi:hypothetical protein